VLRPPRLAAHRAHLAARRRQGAGHFHVRPLPPGATITRSTTRTRPSLRRRDVGGTIVWRPYPGVPPVVALTNGAYAHAPTESHRNSSTTRSAPAASATSRSGVTRRAHLELGAGEATLCFATDPAATADVARPPPSGNRAQFP
jgi:hypothetical protein